ncbi:polysaccharide deacetylase family protein [Candidatus Woesearchaeota archaeon]|jgi:alpha-amylase|nr:polysaccharide deacetylase family protein [Candidatus Woesearchaeota archaeon]MBT5272799.1 polysaccharide deacetylase family protein [Candidatus Woesearchaeota archaeon]MBT6040411.1 polysaccharide deacetylase family protein [Candidatus Woesearchaeota archaeon]MBT6336956.1 polysaccharide deacetylase family protein [Candidatus Woesearchaeota archaeon]MBT7926842.1 polysaccharide deacetylase family protein [Candidatus Woesearchaeota archaeon]
MVSTCFYFQVHQPYRMKNYGVFDIGKNQNYFDHDNNKQILNKVANKCYLPTNAVMLNLLNQHSEFKVAYSFSGVVLDQFQEYNPQVLSSFQRLVETGQVEVLSETFHHSLAFLHSKQEFKEQVELHRKKIKEVFGVTPTIFRNTELIYNNELAETVAGMGYKGILTEGADHILKGRSPNFLYHPQSTPKENPNFKLLLKNYKLSDDIAFRFSNKSWKEHPLTVPKFVNWINSINGNGNCVNLFMDYETFGEHQWKDTGIFRFLSHLPQQLLKHPDNDFKTPSEVINSYEAVDKLDVHNAMSWADVERDLSAWQGNKMQLSALKSLYNMEAQVKNSNNPELLALWRKLTTSDHFYYMCTKWFNDGDVHKYFNPYDGPYDSYIAFMNIVNDLKQRLEIRD